MPRRASNWASATTRQLMNFPYCERGILDHDPEVLGLREIDER
jgi:hypothetical protein